MSNHVHLMIAAREENLSDVLRDFKKFTAKQISALLKTVIPKVGRAGCFSYLKRREQLTAGIKLINSGGRIMGQRNVTVLPLVFKA